MAIRYRCPQCCQMLSIGTRMAGQPSTCPACGAVHVVPRPDSAVDPAARPKSPASAAEAAAKQPPPAAPAPIPQGPSFPATFSTDPLLHRPAVWDEDDEEEEGLVIQPVERKSDELDLIPMVDCVFLLLVFYMITASYALQKTIEMAAPAPDKKGAVQAVQNPDELAQSSIIVQIDARNRIFIDEKQVTNPAGLADALRDKMRGEQKNELVVEADPRAFHETVVAVVDAANELQFQKIRMGTLAADAE